MSAYTTLLQHGEPEAVAKALASPPGMGGSEAMRAQASADQLRCALINAMNRIAQLEERVHALSDVHIRG